MPSKVEAPAHRVAMTDEEYSLLCKLRVNPGVAKTYGIKACNGLTTVGSMLLQTLQAQGLAVDWYTQLPSSAGEAASKSNERWAAFIKRLGKRPGNRLKKIEERICSAPLTAAVRRRGGLPKATFVQLLSMARQKRKREFTSRGNLIGAPAEVAIVHRDSITSHVTKHLRCKCGGRLAFCGKASSQVGVCASWRFVCENSCKLPPMQTSKALHDDDYLLNSKINYACIAHAIPFERLSGLLTLLGTASPSTTDHYDFKHEIEPVLRGQCEESMAEAHERNMAAGNTDYVSIDGGYTCVRQAAGCTMGAHAADGGIIAIEHKRLTDTGATSSQQLESLCFTAILQRVTCSVYDTIIMDGCQALVRPALAAWKRVGGDLWHVQKNWFKWAEPAIKLLCSRPPVPDADKVELAAVAAVKVPDDREGLAVLGNPETGVDMLAFTQQRVRDLGGEPQAGAEAKVLKAQFKRLAQQCVMTDAELRQQAARDRYLAEVARRKAAASAREAERSNIARTEAEAMAWRRELRSLMYYTSKYTGEKLRYTINKATGSEWTDSERQVEWLRLWRQACVKLILGDVTHESLVLLGHPAAKEKEAAFSWKPPGSGFVKKGSFAFEVLDSLISDPEWESKLTALIDGRMTYNNESYFHVLRKWCPQKTFYSRFYSLAIFCSTLSWNENVVRPIVGHKWVRGKSGPLASSAGRWYHVPHSAQSRRAWQGGSDTCSQCGQ